MQGRRTTADAAPPLPPLPLPEGGVRLATSWVEPAYLEPDASWCEPGGEPVSPLANGGAFGGKEHSRRARRRARTRRRASGARYESCTRAKTSSGSGPSAHPISATAVWRDGRVEIVGQAARVAPDPVWPNGYALRDRRALADVVDIAGPPVGAELRAYGLAEQAVLVEGALDAAGVDRTTLTDDAARLDTLVVAPSGARAARA